jgi:predicted dithiol-disulfide oxidoreductase (DUF899 family)
MNRKFCRSFNAGLRFRDLGLSYSEEQFMSDGSSTLRDGATKASHGGSLPEVVDREAYQGRVDELRIREKEHTHAGDAIAAARRRLPMVEVRADAELEGPNGPATLLDAFEGRKQLIAYYQMWFDGEPAAKQCEGCTWNNTQVVERAYLNSRDITYAVLSQGPFDATYRYREFMGWDLPWYSARPSIEELLVGKTLGMMQVICYVRDGDRVFETYATTNRGVEVVDYNYRLMDLTVYGRQEEWEDSPDGWPQKWGSEGFSENVNRYEGRPIAQWSRVEAGRADDLTTT